jgi:hypothetical protein
MYIWKKEQKILKLANHVFRFRKIKSFMSPEPKGIRWNFQPILLAEFRLRVNDLRQRL